MLPSSSKERQGEAQSQYDHRSNYQSRHQEQYSPHGSGPSRQTDGHTRSPGADGHHEQNGYIYRQRHAFSDSELSPVSFMHSPPSPSGYRQVSHDLGDMSLTTSPETRSRQMITHPATDGPSRKSSKRVRTGEDTLTVRRREANRLAAQRFRSRKKGYQDSLEDRIKILEHEKDMLTKQSDEFGHAAGGLSSLRNPPSALRSMLPDIPGDSMWDQGAPNGFRLAHNPIAPLRLTPPDQRNSPVDTDLRIAALESANKRLQEEIRDLSEENERLHVELRWWRDASIYDGRRVDRTNSFPNDGSRWRRRSVEANDMKFTRTDDEVRRHELPPLDIVATSTGAYPTPSTSYPVSLPPRSPHKSEKTSERTSPSLRLPPLRWPSFRNNLSSDPPVSSFHAPSLAGRSPTSNGTSQHNGKSSG